MLAFLLACVEEGPDRGPDAMGKNPDAPGAVDDDDPNDGTAGSAGTAPDEPTAFPTEPGEPIEVCINEFMPDTVVSATDEDGVAADWIELHNPTADDVSLAGWSLTDDPNEPEKHLLDSGLVLEAGGFLVLWADDEADRGPTHLGFALSDEGEAVALYDPMGNGSIVWYGPVGNDLAVARETDCCSAEDGCFGYLFAGTPGGSNASTPEDSGP